MSNKDVSLLIDTLGGYVGIAQNGMLTAYEVMSDDDKAEALDDAVGRLPDAEYSAVWAVVGPGNFTAIRVGIGYARAVAWRWAVPSFGLGVFDLDHSHLDIADAVHFRDARGGRFYRAAYQSHRLTSIELVEVIEDDGYSAEGLDGAHLIVNTQQSRAEAMATLSAFSDRASSPASALYVRGPNAAPSSDPALVILDD